MVNTLDPVLDHTRQVHLMQLWISRGATRKALLEQHESRAIAPQLAGTESVLIFLT